MVYILFQFQPDNSSILPDSFNCVYVVVVVLFGFEVYFYLFLNFRVVAPLTQVYQD